MFASTWPNGDYGGSGEGLRDGGEGLGDDDGNGGRI
jgi:hypothetical protein